MATDFHFIDYGYDPEPGHVHDFYFWPEMPQYFVIKGDSDTFISIHASPNASISGGKVFISGPGHFTVVDLSDQGVLDWYSTDRAGRAGEVLDYYDITDVSVDL